MEADRLEKTAIGGIKTKVVALGIGSGITEFELNNIATAPPEKNVILVQDYGSLTDVEEQLRSVSCEGQ